MWDIWGSDGWQFILKGVFGGYGSQTGIGPPRGSMLNYIKALHRAIREENKAERRACWEAGHFVGIGGKCYDDPEVGLQRALNQASKSTTDSLRDIRIEGYIANQFYKEWFEASENEDYDKITSILNKYGEYSDVMTNNVYIGGMSFAAANPKKVLDEALIGNNDWGVTVQICSSTVTTNCVDPTNIKDIWEDFGRHIQVIFKGLNIPNLPEWLPLPGIMRLPTIGEIWDKVTGPFNDAAKEQMKECMGKDDDGDGVPNTASYCMANRDIVGIITKGLEDGASEIGDATAEAVGGIVDKALEGIDCIKYPVACARKIKDTVGGIDPTSPGLPPWMKVIIVGAKYGDDIIKELEKLFEEDINNDGVIGFASTDEQVECWNGTLVDKQEDCPPREGFTPEQCSQLGRTHELDSSNKTLGSCGACSDSINTVPEDENDSMSPCVSFDDPNQQEGDPCSTGSPLNAEGTVGPAPDFDCIPNEGTDCNVPETGKEGTIKNGVCNPLDIDDGTYEPVCNEPRPTGQLTFQLQEQQDAWDAACKDTHCNDGSLIPENGVCEDTSDPTKECDNGATNYPDCDQCEKGESPDAHINSDCGEPLKEVGTNQGDACDLNETGEIGVVSYDGSCVAVGSNCNFKEANPGTNGCDTGQGFYTPFGSIDSNGDCVCKTVCDDPNRKKYPSTGECMDECKDNFDQPAGYDVCTSIEQLCADGKAAGYESGSQACANFENTGGPCPTFNGVEGPRDADGECIDCENPDNFNICFNKSAPQQCLNEAGDPTGANYPDCTICPAGQDFNLRGVCASIEELCADGVEGYGPENPLCGVDDGCPQGQTKFDGENCDSPCPTNSDIGASSPDCTVNTYQCDDPNATVLEGGPTPGACGPCKEGYIFDGSVERCVRDLDEGCINGAIDDPDCTTCPEGSSMNEEGMCVTFGVPTPPPETGGGGGGGGGDGGGAFTPFLAGISYTPQIVPDAPAPAQKDYMAELDNIIKRSLFEGMV